MLGASSCEAVIAAGLLSLLHLPLDAPGDEQKDFEALACAWESLEWAHAAWNPPSLCKQRCFPFSELPALLRAFLRVISRVRVAGFGIWGQQTVPASEIGQKRQEKQQMKRVVSTGTD